VILTATVAIIQLPGPDKGGFQAMTLRIVGPK
jgi:hypothetical protein